MYRIDKVVSIENYCLNNIFPKEISKLHRVEDRLISASGAIAIDKKFFDANLCVECLIYGLINNAEATLA